ncbi:hypothetical protein VCHA38O209_140030 [Vibrio chagasii]|nr:hypothetical protein VCHA53O468_140031 [Vibrio chagasii]CAH7001757.1 hypothetical protein VCHA55O507_130117 [Vibrio chagasii]CAH7204441.1 hypothetical protein VCHA38O209_140030 [Vibrio chagasii]CAK2650171.1 hypothetical protein VCRA2113O23_160032 [Vibrio crassostreae]
MIDTFSNESCQNQSNMAQACLRGAIELVNLDKSLSADLASVAFEHATTLHKSIESNARTILTDCSKLPREIYSKLVAILGDVKSWGLLNAHSQESDNQEYEEFLTATFSLIDKVKGYISRFFQVVESETTGKKKPHRCCNKDEVFQGVSIKNISMPIEDFLSRTSHTLPSRNITV